MSARLMHRQVPNRSIDLAKEYAQWTPLIWQPFGGRNPALFAHPDFTIGLEFAAKCGMPDGNSSWQ